MAAKATDRLLSVSRRPVVVLVWLTASGRLPKSSLVVDERLPIKMGSPAAYARKTPSFDLHRQRGLGRDTAAALPNIDRRVAAASSSAHQH